MIIPELGGGLGNQMFQIANAYACAQRCGDDFSVNYNMGQPGMTQGNPATHYQHTIYKNIQSTSIIPDHVSEELTFCYSPIIATPNTRYRGYFQSAKYFEDVDLFGIFHVEMKAYPRKTIGLHVRRGDYTHKPLFHNLIPERYYTDAIEQIPEKNVDIVMFTDSKSIVENEFIDIDYRFDESTTDVDVFYNMCSVDYLIGANSSFSWWAAYLGCPEQVFFPDPWFGPNGPKDYQDMYMDHFNIIAI